jgi:hypothetical protein
MAAMNFVGEENSDDHDKNFVMKAVHALYDFGASTGLSMMDPGNVGNPGHNPIPNPVFPERWQTGNILEKALSNLDPLMHDVGPGNIKPKTAGEMMGASTTTGLAMIMKALTTEEGTAGVVSRLVLNAQNDLNPFISAKTTEEQVQILTDYLREGSAHYWEEQANKNHMTLEQVNEWRQNPGSYRKPDGSKPKSFETNKPINKNHMRQIQEAEQKTRPANQ